MVTSVGRSSPKAEVALTVTTSYSSLSNGKHLTIQMFGCIQKLPDSNKVTYFA